MHEPAVPLIAIDFAFAGGADQDPPARPASPVLSLRCSTRGPATRLQDLPRRLERKAIELAFRADRDNFRGTLRTLTENRDEAFEYLRLSLNAPRFDPSDVERSARRSCRAAARDHDPNDIASRRWWATAFPDHPYGRPVNGTLESVPTITADDLKAYTHRVLARDNLKIAIVGDIDAETRQG